MRGSGQRFTRSPRKRKPRVVKGLLRIGVGTSMLYLTTGTNRAVKLLRKDMETLETDTRKHIEEMTEEELEPAMDRLGIKSIALTDDEKLLVMLASKYVLMSYFLLSTDESTS